MQVICPGCGKRYSVEDGKLEQAKKMKPKCKACGALLFPAERKEGATVKKTMVMQSPPRKAAEGPAGETQPDQWRPERLGNCRILETIGVGGMGVVYKALDESLHRHVAIKTLSKQLCASENYRSRFLVEARALARLVHTNITQIYSAGEEGNLLYFVMEYVDGPSTEHLLEKEQKIEIPKAVKIIREVCEGLRKALQLGVIHRDIKPGNILLTSDGIAKITDFGLAKLASEDQMLTQTGMALGTPSYISPEQAQSENVDFRSDIYSLGATLYHFVLGKPPFEADSAVTLVMKHINEPVRFPVQVTDSAIPPLLAGIMRKMMSKSPDGRYQSYNHLIDELARFEKMEQTRTGPELDPPKAPRKPRPGKEKSGSRPNALIFAALIVLGLAGYFVFGSDETEAPLQTSQPEAAPPPATAAPEAGTEAVGSVAVEVGPQKEARENIVRISLIEKPVEKLQEDNYRFYGTIVNLGEESIDGIYVEVALLDVFEDTVQKKDIQVVPDVVMPGESARYSILITDAEQRFEKYRIKIWDKYDPNREIRVEEPEE